MKFFFPAIEYFIKTIRQRVNRVIYCNAFFSVMQLQITKYNTNIFFQLSSQREDSMINSQQ